MVERVIAAALKRGELTSGQTVVEASSGNTGIALASYCVPRGFSVEIFVSDHIADEKKQKIRGLGAELIEVDTSKNSEAEIEAAKERGSQPGSYYFNQFENPHHMQAYKESLAEEIVMQLKRAQVKVDVLLGGVGTGASLRAVADVLRSCHNTALEVYPVFPMVYPTVIEGVHPVQLRGAFKIWSEREEGFESGEHFVSDNDAVKGMRVLYKEEQLLVGPCSGALYIAASRFASSAKNILLILSDTGDRYGHLLRMA
jgi:cysteine synthase A